MKNALRAFTLLCGLLIPAHYAQSASVVEVAVKARCTSQSNQKTCKKSAVTPKNTPRKAVKPVRQIGVPEMTAPTAPLQSRSALSRKQEEMREAFTRCMQNATPENPVGGVRDYVFQMQAELEDGGIGSFFRALRGSTTHHGHEVCLVRAFGLRGFRNVDEVRMAHGTTLFLISSPYVDVVESEIPPDRRVARAWVGDYVHALGEDMHRHYEEQSRTEAFAPLRITSIIRSYEEQAITVRRGLSPADCRYEFLCSSHTSGSSIDLGFRNVSRAQQMWLERRLVLDQRARKIYFIREGSHFHVFVIPPQYMGEE